MFVLGRWPLILLVVLALASGTAEGALATPMGQSKHDTPESAEIKRLDKQAEELYRQGRYDEAIPLVTRLLALEEKILGSEHPDVATTVNNLGLLYNSKRDFARAETLHRRALAIREKGKDQLGIATSLNNLAMVLGSKGDLASAEPLLVRSRALLEKLVPETDPDFAQVTINLAEVYFGKGNYDRAEPLFQQALKILEQAPDADPSNIVLALLSLASIEMRKDPNANPLPLLERALGLQEKALGLEHPNLLPTLNELGGYYRYNRESKPALQMYQRGLAIAEKAFGPDHLEVGRLLNNLGLLYFVMGAVTRAEPLFKRALVIAEKALGPEHPDFATGLKNLAAIHDAKGEHRLAVLSQQRAENIVEHNLNLILSTGSEDQKQFYLDTLTKDTNATISLHVRSAPQDQEAAQLALTTILRRKGRALDAMTDQMAGFRRMATSEDKDRFHRLTIFQTELAKSQFAGNQIKDRAPSEERLARERQLAAEIENLQAEISRRSTEFRVPTQPTTLQGVQKALPDGVALVEIFSYVPGEPVIIPDKMPHRPHAHRYIAYVVRNKGPIGFVELGFADVIDEAATKFLTAISNPATPNTKESGRVLDELVGRPIRKLLGNTRRVLISPDGQLNLVPFAALVNEQGKFFVEDYTISYLTSGRDLLRLSVARQSKQGPVVIANPTFAAALSNTNVAQQNPAPKAEEKSNDTLGRRSGNLEKTSWTELSGSAEEAKSLKALLPNARLLTGTEATEGALKQLVAPRILHLSTHGFFRPNELLDTNSIGYWVWKKYDFDPMAVQKAARENQLLRSGLVLAGANNLQGGGVEDGVLYAHEAAGLNLWGTKLVVLSACDTAVGDVRSGEGVYGLRRALVLAGTESQMMTLWKVDDTATSEMIIDYYERLQAGEGRTEALRQVQLEFLKRKTRQHPFYWASFILNGDWRSMRLN